MYAPLSRLRRLLIWPFVNGNRLPNIAGSAALVRVFAKAERRRLLSLCSLGVRPERFLRMAGIEPAELAVSQCFARAPPSFSDVGVQAATRRSHRGRRMDIGKRPFFNN